MENVLLPNFSVGYACWCETWKLNLFTSNFKDPSTLLISNRNSTIIFQKISNKSNFVSRNKLKALYISLNFYLLMLPNKPLGITRIYVVRHNIYHGFSQHHLMFISSFIINQQIAIKTHFIASFSLSPYSGLFLECPGVTSVLLKSNLQHIQSPIQSLSIYDFDRTITTLTNDLFASSSTNGLQIKHLQFSNSNIQMLKENSLINLKDSLESLSIANGKLKNVSKHFDC